MTYVELPYFPLYAGDWLAGEATAAMLPEQEGAFIRLLCHSWRAKDVPCSLPDDDVRLAQMSRLYGRWAELGPIVREQFDVVDGRLRNAKLWEVYVESQERHARHVANGRKGGRPAKAPLNPGLSPAKARPKQSESEEETTTTLLLRAREVLPESAWGALDAVLATASNPKGAASSIIEIAAGMPNLKPTREQMGVAVQDYAANGEKWNAAHFRKYVQRVIRGDANPAPLRPAFGKPRNGPRTYTYEEPAA